VPDQPREIAFATTFKALSEQKGEKFIAFFAAQLYLECNDDLVQTHFFHIQQEQIRIKAEQKQRELSQVI
jgi:hypothetical protein